MEECAYRAATTAAAAQKQQQQQQRNCQASDDGPEDFVQMICLRWRKRRPNGRGWTGVLDRTTGGQGL